MLLYIHIHIKDRYRLSIIIMHDFTYHHQGSLHWIHSNLDKIALYCNHHDREDTFPYTNRNSTRRRISCSRLPMCWIANLWDSPPYNQLHRRHSYLNKYGYKYWTSIRRMLKYDKSICTHKKAHKKNELQLTGIPHCL